MVIAITICLFWNRKLTAVHNMAGLLAKWAALLIVALAALLHVVQPAESSMKSVEQLVVCIICLNGLFGFIV